MSSEIKVPSDTKVKVNESHSWVHADALGVSAVNEKAALEKQPTNEEANHEYSDEIKHKADDLIRDPRFFYRIGEALETGMYLPDIKKDRYVLGEDALKRHVMVNIATAELFDSINIISGGYATDKDSLAKMVFRLTGVKYESRGYLTAAGLRYSDTIKDCEVLYLPEASLGGEKGRQLRFMRSDDGGFEIEYAYKDKETGLLKTAKNQVNVKTILITTNDVTFDEALESGTGTWIFVTDDSEELNNLVIKSKLQGFVNKRVVLSDDEIITWNCAFDTLVRKNDIPDFISIPYARKLVALFDVKKSKSRRNPDKLADLIRRITILRRYQKEESVRDSADIVDLFIALRIGGSGITENISSLSQREEKIFNAIKSTRGLNSISRGLTAKEISAELENYSQDTCYRIAENLVKKGYLTKERNGKENEYFVKDEQKEVDKVGLNRIPTFEDPKLVLEGCIRLLYPFFDLGNSDEDISTSEYKREIKEARKAIKELGRLIDPITGVELKITLQKANEHFEFTIEEIKSKEIDTSKKY